jgi:CubicO group peptidase (beta-lactamase class C family)
MRAWCCLLLVACSEREAPVHQEPLPDAFPETTDTAPADPSLTEAERAKLDEYLAAQFKSHEWPSMAAGIVYGDTLVYSKGFGTGVDEHTVFRIGSVTKLMTGATVLQRRDNKELTLDDPVDKYIPELATFLGGKVTIRHLVTHTSGIPSVGDGTAEYWDGDHDVTEAELFAAIKGSTLQFEPGTKVAYSNFAVALAGIIAGRVAKESYRDMIEGALFEPLKMTESTWDKPTEKLAKGHWLTATGWGPGGPHWRLGAAEPAGGLYSTVSDVARFLSFEARAESELDTLDTVLSRASLKESQTASGVSYFGVNWAVGKNDLGKFVSHNGSVIDYSASVQLYPSKRAAIVLLLNTGNAEQLDCVAHEALGSLLRASTPKPCVPALTTWNATALDRVKALIASPNAAGIDAAFAPGFKRDELLTFFNDCNATYGACTDATVLATADTGAVRVRLACAKKPANVLIAASPASSIIDLLYIAP